MIGPRINTAFGTKTVARIVNDGAAQYVLTLPTSSAPHGEWWVMNPQRGWVPVPSNGRALLAATGGAL